MRAFLLAALLPLTGALGAAPPSGLLIELLRDPSGTVITDPTPEFSWIVNDPRRGARQTAWQIEVSSAGKTAWDSGRVASPASVDVPYAGPALRDNTDYAWRVRVWDDNNAPSPWSAPQAFRAGSLREPGPLADPRPNTDWSNRLLLTNTLVPPVTLVSLGDGRWRADFGRAAFGTLRLTLNSPDARTVTIHLGEVATPDGALNRKPGGTRRYRAATTEVTPGRRDYRVVIPPDKRNSTGAAILMPPSVGEVLPFRYAELENVPGSLRTNDLAQIAVHAPFNDTAASFACSDETLNRIWDFCRYSIKATTVMGVYIDGDRERIPYEGDALINQLGHYATDREPSLARYSIHALMARPTWPAEWQLNMPVMAWLDYLHTGNREVYDIHADALAAKTLQGLAREDGLIVEDPAKLTPAFNKSLGLGQPPKVLVDWPPSERDGYDMKPVNAVANAWHYHALNALAQLAAASGKPGDWSARADRVRASFQRVFFDEKRGVYRDAEGSEHASMHANLFALAFGLVPPEHRASVTAFVKSRGMACSVYAAQHLLDGLFDAGDAATAIALMTADTERSWSAMMKAGSTISMEAWGDRFKSNQDWNHAWGAAPANVLPRHVLGVQPLAPGFARLRIKPQLGPLTFARGTVPTLRGPVTVDATRKATTSQITLTTPANTVSEVWIPAKSATAVRESGKPVAAPVKFLRTEDAWCVFEVPAGRYVFESR